LAHDVLQFLSNARPLYRSINSTLTDVHCLDTVFSEFWSFFLSLCIYVYIHFFFFFGTDTPVAIPGDAGVKNSNITGYNSLDFFKEETSSLYL
jgi:hypothetical protein